MFLSLKQTKRLSGFGVPSGERGFFSKANANY